MREPRVSVHGLLRAPIVIARTRPVAFTLLAAGAILVAPRLGGVASFAGVLLACALTYNCGAHASPGRGGFAVAALVVAMQVNMGFSEFPNVEIAFPTLVPFWVGYQVRQRSLLVSRLAGRARELEREQVAFTELSVRRERARIARELHDIVAHHLAVVVVQAGAGRMAALGPGRRAPERFAVIRESCEQSLTEMARLVDILQSVDDHHPGTSGRWRLLGDQAYAGGVELQITTLPPGARLLAEIDDDAYSVVREGLTNTIKHAPGARVSVRLSLRDGELEIDIHDDGPRDVARLGHAGAGLGLIGMRERVESTGGTLEAGPDPAGGWRLRAGLPVAPTTVIRTG
jgi:signal transduction histidine kinase